MINNPMSLINSPLPPFSLVYPVTDFQLKHLILNYLRLPTANAPIGTTALPCSAAEICTTSGLVNAFCFHPWIYHMNEFGLGLVGDEQVLCCPIAHLHDHRSET